MNDVTHRQIPTREVVALAAAVTLTLAAVALWWATYKLGPRVCVARTEGGLLAGACYKWGEFTQPHSWLAVAAALTTAAAAGAALAAALTRRTTSAAT